MLWKYPDLHREMSPFSNGGSENIFHSVVQNSELNQKKLNIDILKVLIDHEVQFCANHEGKKIEEGN